MKNSEFQFTNPSLVYLHFDINDDFEKDDHASISLSFEVDVTKTKNKNEAIVELSIVIGSKDDNIPFYIEAKEGAKFRWNENATSREDTLLNVNAPSLLLSYLRPIITMMTASSPFATYNIPFIDFTKNE